MKTEKLYYEDARLQEFTARVISCAAGKNGFEVVLDRSAFYPEGGGQPGDTGKIGGAEVTDTHERNGLTVHYCKSPLEAGDEVSCAVDWSRRLDLMQQHSGEHVVSGMICRSFGCDNVGFHLGSETVTIDFNADITPAQLARVEREANEYIRRDIAVQITFPSSDELREMTYRSKKELEGQVRIVEFPGADVCACCGTHVARTGEIGIIKLLSVQKFREGVRIEMVSGARAYEYLRQVWEQNSLNSAALSAKPLETAEAVDRVCRELAGTKYRLVGYENKYFELLAESFAGKGDALLFEDGLSPDGLRRLALAVTKKCGGGCAVFSGSDGEGYKYAVGLPGGDLRNFVKEMNGKLRGRGGGKPDFVQGTAEAGRDEIELFFKNRGIS